MVLQLRAGDQQHVVLNDGVPEPWLVEHGPEHGLVRRLLELDADRRPLRNISAEVHLEAAGRSAGDVVVWTK